ncbi:helix-turn-helix transcriptional regulator [Paenibacillus sp. IITD108]|uniref:helix-turn-helix transcriptional regulator n=1 Tax=Paenibacillus sp. IITD108 TaxID=3116649 RepID=UPI002F3E5F5F
MNNKPSRGKEGADRTRRSIIKLLKHNGAMDAHQLAGQLQVTAMAVRQHLYDLQEQEMVDYTEEPRAMGRPAKMWRLTTEANRLFPDGYAELTIGLIESMKETFGEEGLDRLLEVHNRKLSDSYLSMVQHAKSLKVKLEDFAKSRTAEGYMAEVVENENGSYYFIEKHCPICEAAKACTNLCKMELEMFRTVIGEGTEVIRGEHILKGDNRCLYKVTPNTKSDS